MAAPSTNRAVESLLLDLIRLGAKGDAASVRQLARRAIAQPPSGLRDTEKFRQEVGQLLLTADAQGTVLRRASPLSNGAPSDDGSAMPLLNEVHAQFAEAPTNLPVLNKTEHDSVLAFIGERRERDALGAAGLMPPRTLLLAGPPGVGKTMTAVFIAAELGLPIYALDLAALMSSFLGRTGQNLRKALDFARGRECVVLLDEFDALAKRRDDEADVGELKRIVNVLLLELESWPAQTVLIAATNHPELLDRAVGRRFDARVDLKLPDLDARTEILHQLDARLSLGLDTDVIGPCALVMEGMSGSDIVRLVTGCARRAIVDNTRVDRVLVETSFARLIGGAKSGDTERAAFAFAASRRLGMSHRAIAELLGVTHPTVGRLIRTHEAPPRL